MCSDSHARVCVRCVSRRQGYESVLKQLAKPRRAKPPPAEETPTHATDPTLPVEEVASMALELVPLGLVEQVPSVPSVDALPSLTERSDDLPPGEAPHAAPSDTHTAARSCDACDAGPLRSTLRQPREAREAREASQGVHLQWAEALEACEYVWTEYGLQPDATEREIRAFWTARQRSDIRAANEGASKKRKKRGEGGSGYLESHTEEEAGQIARALRHEVEQQWSE